MQFSKIITNVELADSTIKECAKRLTNVFLDMSSGKHTGTGMGPDPFLFNLTYPAQHVLSYWVDGYTKAGEPVYSIPTAATTGKRIFWNPDFIMKYDLFALRDTVKHEGFHCHYDHIERRGIRNPLLWNVCVDYSVNYLGMEDIRLRGFDPAEKVKKHCGQYCTLKQLEEMIVLKKINLEGGWWYSDPELPVDLRTPERLYKHLYDLMQSNGYNLDKEDDFITSLGGHTRDTHLQPEETQQESIKRMLYAANAAKQMNGTIPAGIAEELGELIKPKIRWQDSIRMKYSNKIKTTNDWSRLKSRPLFMGLMNPKKRGRSSKFCCLLDSSGSMQKDDFIYGVSQLQGLQGKASGHIVCADSQIYWNDMTLLEECSKEYLQKIKICGRGGTLFGSYFSDYEKYVGKCDFLVVITDGFLCDIDISNMINPGIPVFWLITSNTDFKPPFGKVYQLRN
jgi:predicted metal-dependent peptidase